jgi:hypothetical protein
MALPILGLVNALIGPVTNIIDDLHVSDEEKAEMKRKAIDQIHNQKLSEIEVQMQAIMAEAQSQDPWTSRARPSFFYVMYFYLVLAPIFGLVSVINPEALNQVASGMNLFLDAIPHEMWWLFGTAFLGYTGARSLEKMKDKTK